MANIAQKQSGEMVDAENDAFYENKLFNGLKYQNIFYSTPF
jgi:hypothetical protein